MPIYLTSLLILGFLAVLMDGRDVATITIFVTLGLGLPIVFSATGVVYGLCLAPLVACRSAGGWARAGGAAAAAILVALAALVPNYVGRRDADAAAAARLEADHAPKVPFRAATLEIRRPADSFDGTFADQQACGIECRALLTSGQVRWVRVVEFRNDRARTPSVRSLYRALHGKECAVPGGKPDDSAVCVVEAADPGDAADLVVDFLPSVVAEPIHLSRFASIISERAIVARTSQADQVQDVMRETEVTVETPFCPTLLGPKFKNINSGGTGMVFHQYEINPLTLAGALTRLGYSLAPPARAESTDTPLAQDWRAPLDDNMTREMIAVLDLPGDQPFNQAQMATIFNWTEHAANVKVWTPDLIALLRRVVRDRRVRGPTFFPQIFARRPEVAKALLPDVLDVIERDGIDGDYTPARQAAYTFVNVDEALLRPYAKRIVALLDKSQSVRAILLPTIGRIGVDPLQYLTPLSADLTSHSQYFSYPRTIGACRADPQWAKELIPVLREAYRDTAGMKGGDRQDYRELLLKALTNMGDRDFVDAELASSSWIDGKRLQAEIAFDLTEKNPAAWLCR